MTINVQRLSYGIGAEISGFDLSRSLDQQTIAEIRSAWLEYQILLIRGQEITPEQHIEFTGYFGQQEQYPLKHYRLPGYPEIFCLSNMDENGQVTQTADVGREWHTDMSWSVKPALGSILRCIEAPSYGGTTIFSNAYMAYERLSPAFRRIIDPLYAVHQVFNPKSSVLNNKNAANYLDTTKIEEMLRENPPVLQPVVRVHPETGRRALYVCENVTTRLVGCSSAESEPILQYLFKVAAYVEYTYRHAWRPNDIIMWDNRCTLHMAVPDNDHVQRRLMHRTTVLGTGSGELAPVDDTYWYDERDVTRENNSDESEPCLPVAGVFEKA